MLPEPMTTKVVLWAIQLGNLPRRIPQIMDWFNRFAKENATAISAFGEGDGPFCLLGKIQRIRLNRPGGFLTGQCSYQELDKHACDPKAITELILTVAVETIGKRYAPTWNLYWRGAQ